MWGAQHVASGIGIDVQDARGRWSRAARKPRLCSENTSGSPSLSPPSSPCSASWVARTRHGRSWAEAALDDALAALTEATGQHYAGCGKDACSAGMSAGGGGL